jgi:hypothetical protein
MLLNLGDELRDIDENGAHTMAASAFVAAPAIAIATTTTATTHALIETSCREDGIGLWSRFKDAVRC